MRKTPITACIVSLSMMLGTSMGASADDAPPPQAPTNVPTSPAPLTSGEPAAESDTSGRSILAEPTFRSETRHRVWPNGPLLATGATVFTAAYLPAVIGGAVSERGDDDLYIPVAGPWMTLKDGPDETGGEKTLLIIDGVAQGLGALMMVSSLFIPKKRTSNWYLIGMTPGRVGGGYGLGAAGRF